MLTSQKPLKDARRWLIVGSSGSGKSTLASLLGKKLDLPVVHLDRLLYGPNWQPLTHPSQVEVLEELVKQERWIIEGDFNETFGIRFARAEALVDLALPRLVCITRAFYRWIKRGGQTAPDLAKDCVEGWDWDNLKWIWQYPTVNRPLIKKALETHGRHLVYCRLNSSSEVASFLDSLEFRQGEKT